LASLSSSPLPLRTGRVVARLAALSFAIPLGGCRDGTGADDEPVRLFVGGVRVDPARFAATGEFVIGLVASYANGALVPADRLELTGELADRSPLTLLGVSAEPPPSEPIALAIDLDDSGSMASSDAGLKRAEAARALWQVVLPGPAGTRVALFDFGHRIPTPGFRVSRILQAWTADTAQLEAALANVHDFGDTFLYTSVWEMLAWIDATVPAGTAKRVMVLLSDGLPEDPILRAEALLAVRLSGVVVHTVGLGVASATSPHAEQAAVDVLREIARIGGGVYAPAPDAVALVPIFRALGEVTLSGAVFATFRVSAPPSSGIVSGTLTASVGGQEAKALFSFPVP
jgi:hypothetical protein